MQKKKKKKKVTDRRNRFYSPLSLIGITPAPDDRGSQLNTNTCDLTQFTLPASAPHSPFHGLWALSFLSYLSPILAKTLEKKIWSLIYSSYLLVGRSSHSWRYNNPHLTSTYIDLY